MPYRRGQPGRPFQRRRVDGRDKPDRSITQPKRRQIYCEARSDEAIRLRRAASVSIAAGDGDQLRLLPERAGEQLPEILDLGGVVVGDIGAVGIQRRVILVMRLGGIEAAQRLDARDDRRVERLRGGELGDIGFGDALLLVALGEDFGTILRARVRALVIELGRVVRDREIDLQDRSIADDMRIERDLDGFRVSRFARC